MRSKLTLRMDEDSIERAKRYAAERGISVSKLVENFFEALASDGDEAQMSPLVKDLWGTLEGADVDEADYREHLEEKHL
ncbi:MAG: DUF6364 family protein [Myxococcota bacterium]